MPKDELTTEMLMFLSRFLGKEPVIKKGVLGSLQKKFTRESKVREVREKNETIKNDYIAYVKKKLEVDTKVLDLQSDYADEMPKLSYLEETIQNVQRDVIHIDNDVRKAKSDKPIFKESTEKLANLLKQLQTAERLAGNLIEQFEKNEERRPEVEKLVEKLLNRLKTETAAVKSLAVYGDQPALSPALVGMKITSGEHAESLEKQRTDAIKTFDELHENSLSFLAEIKEKAEDENIDVEGAKSLETDLSKDIAELKRQRISPIMELLDIIGYLQDAAQDELAELAITDPVAQREQVREAKIVDTLDNLHTGIDALKDEIVKLRKKHADAEGFNQKQKLAKEMKDAKEQLEKLEQRYEQLDKYNEQTADRLLRMKEVKKTRDDIDNLMSGFDDDPTEALKEWLASGTEENPITVPELTDKEIKAFTGEGFDKSEIEKRREMFKAASKRVMVEARMFLIEEDLTEISEAELGTLEGMLNAAQKLVDLKKPAEAKTIVDQAIRLFDKFRGSRNFKLPEPTAPPLDPFEQLDRRFKDVGIALDQLWGRGGDADDALRKELAKIKEDREKIAGDEDPNLTALHTRLNDLESKIAEADVPDELEEEDKKAVASAKTTANKLAGELLKVYKTDQIAESEIGKYDRDHLIVFTNSEGVVEYHVIDTKDSDTVDRRDDDHKKVPREAMKKLREQMQMLQLLGESKTAGSADMIKEAVEAAEKLADDVVNKNDVYGDIETLLKKIDELEKDKAFDPWLPDGIGAKKDDHAKFKKNYGGSMAPDDAKKKAEDFKSDFEKLIQDAKELEKFHKKTDEKLKALETDMSAKKKGDEANMGAKLAALIKMDPKSFFQGFTSKPEEFKEFEECKRQITAAHESLNGLSKDFTGIHGALRTELYKYRKDLDTKSNSGVKAADEGADTLRQKMEKQLQDLDRLTQNASNDPLAYLKEVAKFMTACKEGTEGAIKADQDMKTMAKEAKTAYEAMKKWIDDKKNKEGHANYKEYKSIYQGLKSSYDPIEKTFEQTHDAKEAYERYKDSRDNFKELLKDAQDSVIIKLKKWNVEFGKLEQKMGDVVQKIVDASSGIIKRVDEKYETDEHKGQDDADKAVNDTKTTLGLCGDQKIRDAMKFTPGLASDLAKINQLPSTDKTRTKQMLELREVALSDVRRMRSRLESDPVLEVYRNNPIDKGQTWVQLTATLLNMEKIILKDLAP